MAFSSLRACRMRCWMSMPGMSELLDLRDFAVQDLGRLLDPGMAAGVRLHAGRARVALRLLRGGERLRRGGGGGGRRAGVGGGRGSALREREPHEAAEVAGEEALDLGLATLDRGERQAGG